MNKETILHQGPVPYLSFRAYEEIPFIKHGYSTRLGGISTGERATMSFSEKLGDSPEEIRENYRRICHAIGVDETRLVLTNQIHKDVIQTVKEKDIYDVKSGRSRLCGVDGIMTNIKNLTLVCFTADCVPLFFVDKTGKGIGVAHAGWRGTVLGIGSKMVNKMKEEFQSNPEDLVVVIGPSICKECYEVDEEVASYFKASCFSKNSSGRYQLDLWEANRIQLIQAGVKEQQIHISGVCTAHQDKLLFSHRKTKGKRGILAGFLMQERYEQNEV